MARRQHLTMMVILSIVGFLTITYMMSDGGRTDRYPGYHPIKDRPAAEVNSGLVQQPDPLAKADLGGITDSLLSGGTIAPKLENATAKAELGRATWKFLHTMMARFPDEPTADDSLALKSFLHLFGRLYPCGQCAEHFQKMLKQYPPQVSSRTAAAGWACFVHNEVNKRVHKPEFDCSKIGDFYDCGCGDDKGKKKDGSGSGADAASAKAADGSASGGKGDGKAVKAQERRSLPEPSITFVREGLTKGG